jgi:hypothetical protein
MSPFVRRGDINIRSTSAPIFFGRGSKTGSDDILRLMRRFWKHLQQLPYLSLYTVIEYIVFWWYTLLYKKIICLKLNGECFYKLKCTIMLIFHLLTCMFTLHRIYIYILLCQSHTNTLTSEGLVCHAPSTKNLYWCSPSGNSIIVKKSPWLKFK